MYRFTRSALVKPGQGPAAMEFGTKIAAHISENHDTEVVFGMGIAGQAGRIYWYSDYESLASFEALNMGLMQDETLTAMISNGVADIVVAGETHDTIVVIP